MEKPKSPIFEAVHETVQGLYQAGVINEATMQEFDEMCLSEPKDVK